MNKIRILVVEPNKEPYQAIIKNSLKDLQEVVGGLIEILELEPNVDLICNEEGKINQLPLNRVTDFDVIAGTFFIAGHHKGHIISLSEKQIKKYKEEFNLSKHQRYIEFLYQNIRNETFLKEIDKVGILKAIRENIKKEIF